MLMVGVRKAVEPFFRHETDWRASGVVVVTEGPNVNPLASPLAYGEPDTSEFDLAVQLSIDELRTVINVIGEDSECARPFLVALWEKESMMD